MSKCFQCSKPINQIDLLKCMGQCKQDYHFFCVNVRAEKFKLKSEEQKSKWTCPNCVDLKVEDTDVKGMLKTILKKVEKIDSIENCMNTFVSKLEQLETQIQEVKKVNEGLMKTNKSLVQKNKFFETKINDLEQKFCLNNIEIVGIPVTKNEDCTDIVKTVAKVCGITANKEEIKAAYRVYSKNNKVPCIIAELPDKTVKVNWMKRIREKKRTLTAKKIHSTFPESPVYVQDQLTKQNKTLLYNTRKFAKENNFKFVWVSNTRILLRQEENTRIYQIRTEQDLTRFTSTDTTLRTIDESEVEDSFTST